MSGFSQLKPDDAMVRRAQRMDPKALDILFRMFAPAVYTLTLRLTQSAAVADDLTQETFVDILRGLPGFRFNASLSTWVRRIAVSRCLMHMRSAWERKAIALDAIAEPASADIDHATRIELGHDLAAALGELAPNARVVVWLHDVEGYTHREIAELMDKSVSFSKSCLSRAHQQLRDVLVSEEDGSPTSDNTSQADAPAVVPILQRCMQ